MKSATDAAKRVHDGLCTVEDAVQTLRDRYPNLASLSRAVSTLRGELRRLGMDGDGAKLSKEEMDAIHRHRAERLVSASQSVKDVTALPLVRWARRVLATPDDPSASHLDTIIALALVTGRRHVEVALLGRFDTGRDERYVTFSGQAKSGINEHPAYEIPVLAPASDVMAAHVRILPLCEGRTPVDVNNSFNAALNARLRQMDPSLHFHDLRTMYTLLTFDVFRPHTFSINAWGHMVLGHSSLSVSVAYTKLRIVDIHDVVREV